MEIRRVFWRQALTHITHKHTYSLLLRPTDPPKCLSFSPSSTVFMKSLRNLSTLRWSMKNRAQCGILLRGSCILTGNKQSKSNSLVGWVTYILIESPAWPSRETWCNPLQVRTLRHRKLLHTSSVTSPAFVTPHWSLYLRLRNSTWDLI